VILLLNGAFGIGKTTVARILVSRLDKALLFDPEWIGLALQRPARLLGRAVDDFQDLPSWRRLTIQGVRAARFVRPNIVIPMAISDLGYLDEVRRGIGRFEPRLFHVALRAPLDVVEERLRRRGETPANAGWAYRRAAECCRAHGDDAFAIHVDAATDDPDAIAAAILRLVAA
jgi:predicted kinase